MNAFPNTLQSILWIIKIMKVICNCFLFHILKSVRINRRFLIVCLVVCGCFGAILRYLNLYSEDNCNHQIDSILLKVQTDTTKYPNEEYNMIPNVICSNIKRNLFDDTKIMLITQTTLNNLYQIGNLSRKWDGQISVAVYSSGSEVSHTLHYLLLMRKCFEDVRNKVNFHLLYPLSKPPIKLTSIYDMELDCQLLSVLRYKHMAENFALGIPYPVNVARNVALMYSVSDYVLYLDIDLSPSRGMKKEMEAYLEKHELKESKKKLIYILPSFETNSTFFSSLSKEEVIRASEKGLVRQMGIKKCFPCHARTHFSRWLSLPFPSELGISYYVDFRRPYEPYYIAARQHYPSFDTRFKGYGLDRFSQVCEAYVKGHDFAVMNNVFVIHDGFKLKHSVYKWNREEHERNSRIFKSAFIPDLKNKYPESMRECKHQAKNVQLIKVKGRYRDPLR